MLDGLTLGVTVGVVVGDTVGVGVLVLVLVGVVVGVSAGVSVGVALGLSVGVLEGVGVAVCVSAGEAVGVVVGVIVSEGVALGVSEGVLVGVSVGLAVGVSVGVPLPPFKGTANGVIVGVLGGVGVESSVAARPQTTLWRGSLLAAWRAWRCRRRICFTAIRRSDIGAPVASPDLRFAKIPIRRSLIRRARYRAFSRRNECAAQPGGTVLHETRFLGSEKLSLMIANRIKSTCLSAAESSLSRVTRWGPGGRPATTRSFEALIRLRTNV